MTREEMDALVGDHYKAEVAGDLDALVAGFVEHAEHDALGRSVVHGRDGIAAHYRALLTDLRIERLEPVRRWHGDAHVVDESILHGRALGRVFGVDGHAGRSVYGCCTCSTSATG